MSKMRLLYIVAAFILMLPLSAFSAGSVTQEAVEGNPVWTPRYERFFDAKSEGALIPGLVQGFVPQGIGYIPDKDWFVMGGYRDGRSSLVSVVDAATGQHVKTVQFTKTDGIIYTGHAGGLAVSDKHLWISSGEQAHYIELDKLIAAEHGATLPMAGHIDVDARGSFVSFAEGILWVGDFALSPGYPTKPHHHLINRDGAKYLGWMAGYVLDEQTDLISESRTRAVDGSIVPDYVLSIPNKIQEGTIFGEKIILTESYGRNNISHLLVYDNPLADPPHQHVEVAGVSVPVWFLDKQNLVDTWVLTPMAESIVERNGQFHIIFESAAQKYLSGNYTYPLDRIQVIDVEVLLESSTK